MTRRTTPLQKVLDTVLSTVTPPTTTLTPVKQFLSDVNAALKKKKVRATAVLGGSYAKGVWLTGAHDVDIFIRFDKTIAEQKNISDVLETVLKQWKPERVHGSRDYFRVQKDGFVYELVPVIAIKNSSEAKNVTDASPLHTQWALRQLKGLQNDVRLAKLFCKTARVYGAESYIRGFSGHVLDVLIIHSKGFVPFLKAVTSWNLDKKTVIDHHNAHQGKALRRLNTSKTEGPLILVDPVDPSRNAAAAVSTEAVAKLQEATRRFLKKPTTEFFDPTFHPPDSKKYCCIRGTVPEGKPDVVGARFRKAHEQLTTALADFGVRSAHWHWPIGEESWFWYDLSTRNVKSIERKGPPVKLKEHAVAFKKAHKNTIVKKGFMYAKTTPRYSTPDEAVTAVAQVTGVQLRVLR